MMEMAKNRACT
jgi:chromosome condensin MukBEF ATPase and DNA-binding subunit MukB